MDRLCYLRRGGMGRDEVTAAGEALAELEGDGHGGGIGRFDEQARAEVA